MKKFLGLVLAVLASHSAMASQYEIYVTGSTHVSPAQAELATLVQKSILVDSQTKILTLLVTPVCATTHCPRIVVTSI